MQSLGALAIFILICGLLFLVLKWPQSKHVTFSGHAAAYKHTIIYYNLLFTIFLPLLIIFFATWFVPKLHLSFYFLVFIIASSILQYVVTIIPETGGWKTKYHRFLAFFSAILLLPPIAIIAFANSVSMTGRITAFFGLIVMIGIICTIAIRRGKQEYLLLFQIGYFTAFFVTILAATYL